MSSNDFNNPVFFIHLAHRRFSFRNAVGNQYQASALLYNKFFLGPFAQTFARTTVCIAPDLETIVSPCQLGGRPLCSECGCIASAGLALIGRVNLAGLVNVGNLFNLSLRIGEKLHRKTHGNAA
jgi:hypothetical protein